MIKNGIVVETTEDFMSFQNEMVDIIGGKLFTNPLFNITTNNYFLIIDDEYLSVLSEWLIDKVLVEKDMSSRAWEII